MDKCKKTKSFYERLLGICVIFNIVVCHSFLVGQIYDSLTISGLPYQLLTTKLTNDLTLFVIEDHSAPLASAEFVLSPGTMAQKSHQEAMIALMDKFFFRPSLKDINAMSFQKRMSDIGLQFETEIKTETVHFRILFPSKYLTEVLTILRDCWLFPKISDLEFQREKILIARQIQQSETSPTWFLYRELALRVLGKENLSRQTIAADYQNIQKIELQDFLAFRKSIFRPQNSLIAIGGDVNPEIAANVTDSLFQDWTSDYEVNFSDSLTIFLPEKASAFLITHEKVKVPIASVTFPFHDTLNFKNVLIGKILAQIFSMKYSAHGKFFTEQDLGYQMVCDYKPSLLCSEFTISLVLKREKLDLAIDYIRHFPVYAFHSGWISRRDIEVAKKRITADFYYRHQKISDILSDISWHYFLFKNYEFTHYLDSLESIDYEDVISFFNKGINVPNPSVGFLMNSEDVKGSDIEKKLIDFWQQPFGLLYNVIDPHGVLKPKNEAKITFKDTLLIDSVKTDTVPIFAETQANSDDEIFDKIETEKYRIYFEFNSSVIDKPSKLIIEKFAADLKSNTIIKLRLTGHTDTSGPEEYNQKLSLARANSVKKYIVEKYQIDSVRITTVGLGESQPAFEEKTLMDKAKNRRVEIEVYVD